MSVTLNLVGARSDPLYLLGRSCTAIAVRLRALTCVAPAYDT